MVIELLREPSRIFDIMLYLSEKGERDVSTILKDLKIYPDAFYKAIKRLEEFGFVCKREVRGFPIHVYWRLTYAGERAVEHLIPLDKMARETFEGCKRELERLQKARKSKKNKAKILEILAKLQDYTFTLGEWDDTLAYAQEALRLAKELGDEAGVAKAYRSMGIVHLRRKEEDEAAKELGKSLEFALKIDDISGVTDDYYSIGSISEERGEYDEALANYEMSAKLAKKASLKSANAKARVGFGRMLARKGEYEESLKQLRGAVRTFKKLEEMDELALAYGNLGSSSFFVDVDQALKCHEKSMEIANRTGNLRLLGWGFSNAAGCYICKGKFNKSLEYLDKALDISEKIDEKKMICSVLIQYGRLFWSQEKWSKSRESFYRCVDMAEKFNLPYLLGDAFFNLGWMNKDRGNLRKGKSQLEEALKIFSDLGNKDKVAKIERFLEEIRQ